MRHQFLFILLFFYLSSAAQKKDQFQVRQFTTENGLPSNGIKGLQWDEQTGFLWVGTEAGVARFNGIDFMNFSKGDLPGAVLERISSVTKNSQGNIFVLDQVENEYQVAENKLRLLQKAGENSLDKLRIKLVQKDIDTAIISHIVFLTARGDLRPVLKVLRTGKNSALLIDIKKRLWSFTINGPTVEISILPGVNALDLFKINENSFLLNDKNNVYLVDRIQVDQQPIPFNGDNGLPLKLTPSSRLIWENGMQQPILIIGENAWLLNYTGHGIRAKKICDAVPTNSLIRYANYYPKGETLFIGTDSKGILVISRNSVESLTSTQTGITERNAYYSQIKIDDNTILTNTGSMLSTINASPVDFPVKGSFGFRIYQTADSSVWYPQTISKTGNCLTRYQYKTRRITHYEKIKLINGMSICLVDDKIYVATTSGLALLEEDSLRYVFRYNEKLPGAFEPIDLVQYDQNSLLFATCNSILRFDISNYSLDTLFQLTNHCIRTLNKTGDYVFIGTYGGGYYILKNGEIKAMPLDKNNFLLYTHCFVFDDRGFCWLSTNRGLFKAKYTDLIQAFENNTARIYYHYVGKNDGMGITEMNGGCSPCALKLNNASISFPTMDGLLLVNTATSEPLLPEGNIYIDAFLADEVILPLHYDSVISLPANTNNIEIHVGYAAWCNKENIYLDYKINDGPKWKPFDVKNGSIIYLNNLPQGAYKLQIRKINGFGENNYSYQTILFTIATPWYKKWWFYTLNGFVFLGLLYLVLRFRTRQLENNQQKLETQVSEKTIELLHQNEILEKNNTINNRLISIISHDIITPLKFLNVAGKNLLEKNSLMTEDLKDETIKEITTTSQELQLLSTNILNWIKYQNENRRLVKELLNAHDMMNQIFGVLNSMAKQKNLKLVNSVDHTLVVNQFFEPLKILIYNLVTNAIHFSENGSVIVNAVPIQDGIMVSVSDEGSGMTPEQIKNIMANQFIVSSANVDNKKGNGLGYLIIKDLLKMMNAKITINSKKNKGTTVYIELPG